ncbi:MAG: DNA-protecting protein DprA [Gammaproteobacteria bacterium]|nr:DNA-protecting protein DprA [Gammaproteobacteria bacterium]
MNFNTLPEETLRQWLALLRAPGIGAIGFQNLLQASENINEIFNNYRGLRLKKALREETCHYLDRPDWDAVDRDMHWLQQANNHIVSLHDAHYPTLLKEISDAPPLLFLHGNIEALCEPQLAIVGSRNPSPSGKETAQQFAHHLATTGLTITSGLALGIDAASHHGALRAQGSTIAVMGTGLDRIYPAQHHDLAHRIAVQGLLVSEFPPDTRVRPENFPRRNRIISGLSIGTLVVEAAIRSGSLITARCAANQGREVFAIPGSIHNPLARGCHQLIRNGAKLVETAADILEELAPLASIALQQATVEPPEISSDSQADIPEIDAEYQQLLSCIDHSPVSIDQLIERSQLSVETLSSMLLILEFKGHITANNGVYCKS